MPRFNIAFFLVSMLAFASVAAFGQTGPYSTLQNGGGQNLQNAAPPIQTVTVSGSPFVWTNNLGYSANVVLFGGTCTVISISRQGTSVQVGTTCVNTGGASEMELAPGDSISITNSGAPTFKVIPIAPNGL